MDPSKLINEGYKLYIENNSEGALKKYNEALNIALDLASNFQGVLPEALYHRGLAYQQLGKEDEAKKDFSISLRILKDIVQGNPGDFNSKNYLGLVYLKLEQLEIAKKTFTEVIDNVSKDSLEYANASKGIGSYYYERGNYEESLDSYYEALKVYSNYLDIRSGNVSKINFEYANTLKSIANCYYWLTNYNDALKYYEEILKIFPKYVDIYFNKGVVFGTLGEYKDAIESYKQALDTNSNYYIAYNNLSYLLYDIDKYGESLEACNQCLKICSNYNNALSIKGVILLRLGRFEEAIETADLAVKLHPSFGEAWYQKGCIHYFLEQFDEAQEAFDWVIELNQKFVVESLGYKGIIFAKLNDYNNSIKVFSEGEKIVSENINKEIKRMLEVENSKYLTKKTNKGRNYEDYLKAIEKNNKKYLVQLMLRKSFAFYLFDKYQEALDELEAIDRISPTDEIHVLVALKLKGTILEKSRNYTQIMSNFDDTLRYLKDILSKKEKAGSYKSKFYYEKGIILRRVYKNYEESIRALKEAFKENPDHFYSMKELGLAFSKCGKYHQALEAFNKSVKTNPNYYEAWIHKAFILRSLLEYDNSEYSLKKAMEILKSAIKLNRNYSTAYYYLGLIHYDRQEYKDALSCFEKAANNKEFFEDAVINKGLSLFSLKRYDEAIDVFDSIIDTSNSIQAKVDSLNNKGIALLCQGEKELACKSLIEAAKLDKRNPDTINNIGLVNYYKKRYKLALKQFNQAIEIGSKYNQPSSNALSNKGILFFNMGRIKESKEILDEAIRISPQYSSVRKNKGLILCKLGEHEDALKVFREASSIRPEEGEIHVLLAGSLLKLGDTQGAEEEIEEALKDPTMSLSKKSKAYAIKGKVEIEKLNYKSKICAIKGQLEIEKLNYDAAINNFEKAVYFSPSNLSLLIWNLYARYIKTEFLFNQDQSQNQDQKEKKDSKKINSINKKYQEGIISIIRDLEKTCIEFDSKQKSINLHLFFWLRMQSLVNKMEKFILFTHRENKSKEQKIIYRFIRSLKGYISLSIMEQEHEKIIEERMIEAYILYFTGYLYYKVNDFYSALYKLKKCINMKAGSAIDEPARNLIQNVWEYQIRPPFWKWWLYSPANKWGKWVIFGIVSVSIFGVLFPSLTISLVSFFTSFLISFLPSSLKGLVYNLNSFSYVLFSSITDTTQYIILTILFFILLFPSIQHIRSKDFEVDLNNSPVPFVDFCPLTPDFTPEKSTALIQIKKRPKPLEIHEIRDQTSLDAK